MLRRRTASVATLAYVLTAALATSHAGEPPRDAVDEALATQNLTRRDVGWEARGTWEGYPCDVPHKLRHFDDLLAEPFATVPWVRAMGTTVRDLLAPEKLATKGPSGSGALMRAAHGLGVNRRFGGFRSYNANLTAKPLALDTAILDVYRAAGRPSKYVTFGQESPYPLVEKPLAETAAKLPKDVSEVLGQLVANLTDARRWADLAWRSVPMEQRIAVAQRLDLGAEEVDAIDYEPAVDDVARNWDEASLWYAGLKTIEALDVARQALEPLLAQPGRADELAGFRLDHETPWGRILITGTGDDAVDVGDAGAFLIVDLGGNDRWEGRIASSDPTRTIGAMLDMGGNDQHRGTDRTQGSGVCGIGVLLDAAGVDPYLAVGSLSQGAGQFGLGALIDLGGDDAYAVRWSGQGCGYFGVGLLFDCAGDDAYEVFSDGQGFGGVAGVGVLADRSGDDTYTAVVDPAQTQRPSYHQLTPDTPRVSVSNAQGCSMGRRGDGADGHSWAGGLGAILDAEGNDRYSAANWAQGTGYWFGTGVSWDGAGNDVREAYWWNCASGAHFCIGALVDEAGDDSYTCRATNGIAFGHDFTLAVLADLAGNDTYTSANESVARSINRSVAMLLDGGGSDTYRSGEKGRPGSAVFDAKMLERRATSVYWTEPTSVGLFVDSGGDEGLASTAGDLTRWRDSDDSDNVKARNFGIGLYTGTPLDVDRPTGGKRR